MKEGMLKEKKQIQELEEKYCIEIPYERVDLWEKQLNMWKELDKICKRHNLRYFFGFGALIGAVRHKGFIPWDDDIDVLMPRSDYEVLAGLENEFSYPYYLQTPSNSKDSCYFNVLLMDETTACIDPFLDVEGQHQGLKLDIVPLDGASNFRLINKIHHTYFKLIQSIMYLSYCDVSLFSWRAKLIHVLAPICLLFPARKGLSYWIESKKNFRRWDCSRYVMDVQHGYIYERFDFEGVKYLEFEGYDVPVPRGYDNILSTIYGDYMQLPTPEKRTVINAYIENPYRSYRDYSAEEIRDLRYIR